MQAEDEIKHELKKNITENLKQKQKKRTEQLERKKETNKMRPLLKKSLLAPKKMSLSEIRRSISAAYIFYFFLSAA
jgi:hypothetical protein